MEGEQVVKVDWHVVIGRTPDDVFGYITQVERIPEWQRQGGVEKVTKLSDGPLGVGSRFRMERRSRGRLATIDAEVTAFEPGRRFDFHTVDNDGFVGDFATTLGPRDPGTALTWSVRMKTPNLLYRLLEPIIAREIRRSAEVDFAALKRTLEQVA
jgi:uncharacterized protein YndB with AHSA1/START domain